MGDTTLADEALVQAMARGESEGLAALHDRWAPSMLALARQILGDAREADECVHETLLEAWHRARFYRAVDGPVGSWLHLRVRSRALQRAREIGAAEAASAPDPEPLAWLPADERQVLELAYFRGYSCAEIAARLGIPLALVQARLGAAFVLLQQRRRERP